MGVHDPRKFLSHWPVDDAEGLQALQSEMNDVAKLSAEWGKWLAKFPSSAIGVRVLQLFVQDLMGRESRQARIFGNQFESERVEEKVAVTWGMKCLAVSTLIILNIFFIFGCMLYGRDKGLRWQRGWLIASMVNLVADVFIAQVMICGVVYFSIPGLIRDATTSIKATVEATVQRFCHRLLSPSTLKGSMPQQQVTIAKQPFSATDYLFVSTRVAKAFPDLVESAIILEYRSALVSMEQSNKWSRELAVNQQKPAVFSTQWIRASVLMLALFIGSQSLLVQEELVYCLNPIVLAGLASIGTFFFHSRHVGVPVVCSVAALAMLLCWWRSSRHKKDGSRGPSAVVPLFRGTGDDELVDDHENDSNDFMKLASEDQGKREPDDAGKESIASIDPAHPQRYLRPDGVWVATKEELIPQQFRFDPDEDFEYFDDNDFELRGDELSAAMSSGFAGEPADKAKQADATRAIDDGQLSVSSLGSPFVDFDDHDNMIEPPEPPAQQPPPSENPLAEQPKNKISSIKRKKKAATRSQPGFMTPTASSIARASSKK